MLAGNKKAAQERPEPQIKKDRLPPNEYSTRQRFEVHPICCEKTTETGKLAAPFY